MNAALSGTLAAVVVLGFTVTGRLLYRLGRDTIHIRERLARLEGKRGTDDDRH